MSDDRIVLGKRYADTVTGYSGIATAITEYLDDPTPMIRLTSASNDGRPVDETVSSVRLKEVVDGPDRLGFDAST